MRFLDPRLMKDLDKGGRLTKEDFIEKLNAAGIDTTLNEYEIVSVVFDEMTDRHIYKHTFTAPGDWAAYFSFVFPLSYSVEDVTIFVQQYYLRLKGLLREYPTVEKIKKLASERWWGDDEAYIISLKNLTTGEILYDHLEAPSYEINRSGISWN